MNQPGNGSPHRGDILFNRIGVDCVFLTRNPADPPTDEELTNALVAVLQQWMQKTAVRVRETLPVIANGNMIALFVWFDPVNPESAT